MSLKGSEREFLLSLYIMKHKEVLEQTIGFTIDHIVLEKPHGRNKIDLYGVCAEHRLELFVENQVRPTDDLHLNNNILSILQGMQEGIVCWITSSFHPHHLSEVKSYLRKNHRKFINFYAIEINPLLLKELEILNKMYKLDIWNFLDQLNLIEGPPFNLVFKHEQIPSTHLGKVGINQPVLDLENPADVKMYLLNKLRVSIPEMLNLHKEKKCNQWDRILTVGAGRKGVYYRISVEDRRKRAFVELFMDASQEELFKRLEAMKKEIKVHFDSRIQISTRRIGVYFKPDKDIDETIKQIASILSKMVHYFSPYIYEGWENVIPNFDEEKRRKNSKEQNIWNFNDSQ